MLHYIIFYRPARPAGQAHGVPRPMHTNNTNKCDTTTTTTTTTNNDNDNDNSDNDDNDNMITNSNTHIINMIIPAGQAPGVPRPMPTGGARLSSEGGMIGLETLIELDLFNSSLSSSSSY